MPGFEGGIFGRAEKEWGQEMGGEKTYETKWNEAEETLRSVVDDFHANTSMIPVEEYPKYLEAADTYLKIAKNHPGDVNKKLLMIAETVKQEAPEK